MSDRLTQADWQSVRLTGRQTDTNRQTDRMIQTGKLTHRQMYVVSAIWDLNDIKTQCKIDKNIKLIMM